MSDQPIERLDFIMLCKAHHRASLEHLGQAHAIFCLQVRRNMNDRPTPGHCRKASLNITPQSLKACESGIRINPVNGIN
ncbi:MAG: hypothetical protein AAGJ52_13795 [Pseudomonadota bacterium]